MEISKRIRHEHAELRTLAQQILNQGDGAEGRDRDFADYDRHLREHLDVFEAFFLKRLKEDPDARDSVADIKSEHALIRKELKSLNRGDKDTHQWSAEFRRFTDRFEHLCHRHDALVTHAEAGGRSSEWLDRQYEETKARRARSFFSPGRSRGSTAAMVVGAAAAAGAAFVLTRYFKGGSSDFGSRRQGRDWTDCSRSGKTPSGIVEVTTVEAVVVEPVRTRGVTSGTGAPDTDGARTAPDPSKAPNASGITIN